MESLLEMKKITKLYPNVIANKDVDFSLKEGEIHALMGENGAGKSTLMKILFGMEKPDSGSIFLRKKEVKIDSSLKAISLGIGMVHQHFMLAEDLSVTENIILGGEPIKMGLLDYKKAKKMVTEVAEKYNFKIDPNAVARDLSISAKQKVEILKALIRGSKILILDEPTAVLMPQETQELFSELLRLKKDGYTIVFISHKLTEIKHICDRITVMRRGLITGVHDVGEVSAQDISRLMIGRVVTSDDLVKTPAKPQRTMISVKGIKKKSEGAKLILNDVSLSVNAGEIVGLAGVEGNGQNELAEIITGLLTADEGEVVIDKMPIMNKSIKQVRKAGLGHIPEDRMSLGAAKEVSIAENLISGDFESKAYGKGIFFDRLKIATIASKLIDKFKIKATSPEVLIGTLSGGNIQKVVVAREAADNTKILVANQPTRGIDIGASMFIRQNLIDLRDKGTAILLLSADMSELLSLSDRLIVMYGGVITAYFDDTSAIDEEELGWYMLGIKKMEASKIKEAAYVKA